MELLSIIEHILHANMKRGNFFIEDRDYLNSFSLLSKFKLSTIKKLLAEYDAVYVWQDTNGLVQYISK